MGSPEGRSSGGRAVFRLLAGGSLVGAVVGVAIWLFKRAIDAAEWATHGWQADTWMEAGAPLVLGAPILGGLVVGVVLHLRQVPEEPGHGVAEVIESVALGTEEFPEADTPTKAATAAVSLGAGASLGPEDPAVEIGGSIGSRLGRRLGLGRDDRLALTAAGGAAGLSAAFHAPLAAILFSVEVFTLRLLSRTTAVVALTAGVAFGVVWLLDPSVEPSVPAHPLAGAWELPLALGLGVATGGVSALQIRLMYRVEHAVIDARLPRWLKPALGGAVIGLVGLRLPELLGIGYATLEPLLAGEVDALATLLVLGVGKMLLLAVSFGSGFIGGFFAPCLFIGAALGAAYGLAADALLPVADLRAEAFAVAGMAALLAGCVRAPFSAVVLLAALSGGYALTPLLLASALPAFWVSRRLERRSLYTYGIERPHGGPPPVHRDGSPQSDTGGGTRAAE